MCMVFFKISPFNFVEAGGTLHLAMSLWSCFMGRNPPSLSLFRLKVYEANVNSQNEPKCQNLTEEV